jgi:hypothetical protein
VILYESGVRRSSLEEILEMARAPPQAAAKASASPGQASLEIELHSSDEEGEEEEEEEEELEDDEGEDEDEDEDEDEEMIEMSQRRYEEENAAILQAVQDLLALQQSGGNDTAEQVEKHKKMTKDLLERLLGKLESDQEIQRAMEDQIFTLETGIKGKDRVIESFAEQAKEAIDECKGHAETMAEELMTKIETEVNHRSDLEHLVRRLQSKVSMLQSELDVYRAAPNGSASLVELLQRSLAKNQQQKRDLKNARLELAVVKQSRDAEIRALGAACDVIEKQWSDLQDKYLTAVREAEDLRAAQLKVTAPEC